MRDARATPADPSVWVDGATCIGAGNCVRLARGAFSLSHDGVAEVVDAGAVDAAKLRLAERSCPTGAIHVEGPASGGAATAPGPEERVKHDGR